MKKTLLLLLFLLGCTGVWADDFTYNYLIFTQSDGTVQSVSVNNLQITFADGVMKAVSDDATVTITLSDLAKMAFAETATGITNLTDDPITNGQHDAHWYTIDGQRVSKPTQKGLYLMKKGNKTVKILLP